MRRLSVVLSLAAAWCSPLLAVPFQAPDTQQPQFHFVVLGDAQFDDAAKFNRVIDQTRRLGPAFVIQVGDLIDGYNSNMREIRDEWARFSDQIAPLAPIPFLAVPGNHDIYGGNKKPDAKLESEFVERWGALYQAFEHENALFVTLNSDSTGAMNAIDAAQLTWLEKTLAASRAQHKFIFLHRPPFLMRNADRLHALFGEYGVSHVFYGHHHHYHYFERDGVRYSMVNAAADSISSQHQIGGFHHILQVSVRGADVYVAVIAADAITPVDYVAPSDNYDYFNLARELAPDKVVLERSGAGQYRMSMPLRNTSRRDIQAFAHCTSDDGRWRFDPQKLTPVHLAQGAAQDLVVAVSFGADRVPESEPTCHIRVPLQTAAGAWVDLHHTVVADRPEGG